MKQFNCALLVDDDSVTNFIHHRILNQLGICAEIHMEYNGEKALNYLHFYAEQNNQQAPELILLDLRMPVLDGYEFLEYLKLKNFSNKDQIRVIVLTNSSHTAELDKLKKFGVHILPKPLTIDSLNQVLNTYPESTKLV